MSLNIQSDKAFFQDERLCESVKDYPFFLSNITFDKFRHIPSLSIDFKNPISIISGTNRSGKTTILMAIACSHFNFFKRNPNNGQSERTTWSSLMKLTSHDKQREDWTYYITYREGKKIIQNKRGQRKANTNKWNGIAKKESQFIFRHVVLIDLDRIIPARFFQNKVFTQARNAIIQNISENNINKIQSYLSYILEENFKLKSLTTVNDKDIFKYENSYEYSSFNTATGEDTLTRLLIDIIEAQPKSLILIDEIEMGLHPKIQRRLMDVIRNISREEKKQFIITSHSSTILDSVDTLSRIFIEKNNNSEYKAIQNISVNAALSKMDSKSFPLVELYCEDDIAKKIIDKAIQYTANTHRLNNFKELYNIIIIGSADKTYNYFETQKQIYNSKKIRTGYGCILDGDMKSKYPNHDELFFLYSNQPPEKFLTEFYLKTYPHTNIQYYFSNENPHCLFDKIMEYSDINTKDEVFETCWRNFTETDEGKEYLNELSSFLLNLAKKYSPTL